MNSLEAYLEEYNKSHQSQKNIYIHKFSVPIIMFSILGILKALPVPETWPLWLDWSIFFIFGILIFYASFKCFKLFFVMFLFIFSQVLVLEYLRPRFFLISLFLFIIAWIFQFIGHKIEGKKPSFFTNLIFLLIGPVWVIYSNKLFSSKPN